MRKLSKSASPRKHGHAMAIALCMAVPAPTALAASPPQDLRTPSPIDARLLKAMHRDLGLDARQSARYLQTERSATARIPEARRKLGASYAGAWMERGADGEFRLVIAATSTEAAEQVRVLGAQPRIAKRSFAQLETAKRQLDRLGKQRKPNVGIHSWYIDVKTNQVVIEAEYKARDAALDFAALSGIDAAAVRFEESRGVPQTLQIIGGERYNLPNGWCSIGFPVTQGATRGFVTAGHCGGVGTPTVGNNGVAQGSFAGSDYPGTDMAWVQITNPRFGPLRNWVTDYAGGTVPINGAAEAPVGAAVCRSGARTGYRCGVIVATDVTVSYLTDPRQPPAQIFGLIRASACAGRGDSGGSFITPDGQAQGVTSGGMLPSGSDDNCTQNPPITFYQPLQPLLNRYGLTLFTGGPPPPPVIAQFVCPYSADSDINLIACYVLYAGDPPASVTWSGGNGGTVNTNSGFSEYFTGCNDGQTFRVGVTVSNANGSVSALSSVITCNSGPIR